MLDDLPLVILDDADYAALFPTPAREVSRRVILCKRCMTVLALCVLSFAASLPALESYGVEGLVFGVSRHSLRTRATDDEHFREFNPGYGLGFTGLMDRSGDWRMDGILSAGTYADSYGDRASFFLGGFRWTWADRLCVDVSTGSYHGSGQTGFAIVPTAGVRVVGPVWLHLTGNPFADGTQRVAFGALFARVHWDIR